MNNILFISTGYHFNGGSTFLLRMVKTLQKHDVKPAILFLTNQGDQKLLSQLKSHAEILFLKDFISLPVIDKLYHLNIFLPINKKLKTKIEAFEHIHVMGVFTYLFVRLKSFAKKVSIGVYQQHEYFYQTTKHNSLDNWLQLDLSNFFPNSNWVFFNESGKKIYESHTKKSLVKSLLIPIGIDLGQYKYNQDRIVDRKKIVSIGNLWKFKTYNESTIRALKKLITEGHDLEYHIYGDGENESNLKELVKDLKLQEKVFFHGRIEYKYFSEVLSNAFLFIGSGTAIIESSALGIPSIIGIENEKKGDTYGFLFQVDGYSYNEDNLAIPKKPITEVIKSALQKDEKQYLSLCNMSRKKAKSFDISEAVAKWSNWHTGSMTYLKKSRVSIVEKIRLFFTIIKLGLSHILGRPNSYRYRKDN